MGRIKTILASAGTAILLANPANAERSLSRDFAGCAGRLSAEMEHAWLMARENASQLEAERATFLTLLEAVAVQDQARRLMTYRIETKIAHAALLTSADFAPDARRAAQARHIAQNHVTACRRMLLGA